MKAKPKIRKEKEIKAEMKVMGRDVCHWLANFALVTYHYLKTHTHNGVTGFVCLLLLSIQLFIIFQVCVKLSQSVAARSCTEMTAASVFSSDDGQTMLLSTVSSKQVA